MLKSRHCRENISNIKRIIYKKSGVSLVEIIVALLILALAALPAVGTFSSYYATSTKQMEQEMAHALYSLAKLRPQTVGELVQSEILHDWQARLLADEVIPLLEQEPPKLSKKARRRRRSTRRPIL